MKKLNAFGIIAILLSVAGIIMKTQHWPGAGIAFVLAVIVLVLLFLPFLLFRQMKSSSNIIDKIVWILSFIILFILSIGFLFKVQNWPGTWHLMFYGLLVSMVATTLVVLLGAFNKAENNNNKIEFLSLSGSLIVLLLVFYGYKTSLPRTILKEFNSIDKNSRILNDYYKSKNVNIYNAFDVLLKRDVDAVKPNYDKAMKIKTMSEEIENYLIGLKNLTFNSNIKVKIDSIPANFYLCSGKCNKNKDTIAQNSNELKSKLSNYKNFINEYADDNLKSKIDLLIDNSNKDEEGNEINFFYHNAATNYILLTDIETNIRMIECEVVTHLYMKTYPLVRIKDLGSELTN
ncbi:MAG: hypothetical protein Q8880_10695 [Bacteroidota bacterium]|nr:hypothetical protein [Bacteroidota bacterium]